MAREALEGVERGAALAGGGGHAQQRLHGVFGQQVVLQLRLQQRGGCGGVALGFEPRGVAQRGIAPGGAQRVALQLQPLVQRLEAARRAGGQQRRAVQRDGCGPVGAADGGAEQRHVAGHVQAQPLALGQQAVGHAPGCQLLLGTVQGDAQVVLAVGRRGVGPEQRGQPLARHPVALHAQAGQKVARQVGRQVQALATLAKVWLVEQAQQRGRWRHGADCSRRARAAHRLARRR